MFTLAQILCALLLPAGLTLLVAAFARDLATGTRCCLQRGLGGALLASLYGIGHAATARAVDSCLIPPHLGWHWLTWAAAALAVVTLTATPPGRVRWILHAALAGAGAVLILMPLPALPGWQIALWALACAGSVLGTGLTAERSSVTAQLGAGTIAAIAVAAGALLTHSKDLSLLAGILPPILIATWLVWRQLPTWGGGSIALAQLLAWHLTLASTYSEMPWWLAPAYAALLPAGALAGRLGRTPTRATLWQLGITAAAAIVVLGATFLLMNQPANESPGGASAYGY
jgi:hypothetical protein